MSFGVGVIDLDGVCLLNVFDPPYRYGIIKKYYIILPDLRGTRIVTTIDVLNK